MRQRKEKKEKEGKEREREREKGKEREREKERKVTRAGCLREELAEAFSLFPPFSLVLLREIRLLEGVL